MNLSTIMTHDEAAYCVQVTEGGYAIVGESEQVVLVCVNEDHANQYAVLMIEAYKNGYKKGYREGKYAAG